VSSVVLTPVPPDCRDCKHYRETMLFDLCTRPESTYTAEGKTDQHTIGHMRERLCSEGRLFEPKDLTSRGSVRS